MIMNPCPALPCHADPSGGRLAAEARCGSQQVKCNRTYFTKPLSSLLVPRTTSGLEISLISHFLALTCLAETSQFSSAD